MAVLLGLAALAALIENGHLLAEQMGNMGARVEAAREWSHHHPWEGAGIYLPLYVATAMIGLPIHAVFAVYAGLTYPLLTAFLLAWIGRGLGDAAGFLVARYALRRRISASSRPLVARFQAGVNERGLFYLFLARLLPGVPSPIVNIAMGVSAVSFLRFLAVSMAGITLWTAILVYAGSKLSTWRDPAQLLSKPLLLMVIGVVLLLYGMDALWRIRKRRGSRATAASHDSPD